MNVLFAVQSDVYDPSYYVFKSKERDAEFRYSYRIVV